MEKIKNSSLLKIFCYIVIPILVAILVLSLFHMIFLSQFGKEEQETSYSQTENFANNYLYFFTNKIIDCQRVDRENNFIELEDSEGNKYYYFNHEYSYNYYNGMGSYINYIIIDKETRKDVYEYKK